LNLLFVTFFLFSVGLGTGIFLSFLVPKLLAWYQKKKKEQPLYKRVQKLEKEQQETQEILSKFQSDLNALHFGQNWQSKKRSVK